jgi:mannose-6-phosphate isomerase-like protein (cupin superfamily)
MFDQPAISVTGTARRISVFGGIDLRVPAAETGGIMSVWEALAAPDQGPPMHIHAMEDELFYVLEGTFQFWCGNETFTGGPGTTAVLPRNVMHTYKNIGKTTGRFLGAAMPGGFEEFFLEVERTGAMDPSMIAAIGAKYGLTFVPAAAANDDKPRRAMASTDGLSHDEMSVTSG